MLRDAEGALTKGPGEPIGCRNKALGLGIAYQAWCRAGVPSAGLVPSYLPPISAPRRCSPVSQS